MAYSPISTWTMRKPRSSTFGTRPAARPGKCAAFCPKRRRPTAPDRRGLRGHPPSFGWSRGPYRPRPPRIRACSSKLNFDPMVTRTFMPFARTREAALHAAVWTPIEGVFTSCSCPYQIRCRYTPRRLSPRLEGCVDVMPCLRAIR